MTSPDRMSEQSAEKDVRPRHLRPHATFGDDPSGWCGCADCDPRRDCGCNSCRRQAAIQAVHDMEAREFDPSVEQYVDTVLSVLPPERTEA